MQFKEVEKMVDGIPYISKENAYFSYDFIIKNNIQNVLELEIAHGTATCYMAAALDEGGKGHIDAVDLLSVKDHFKPSAQEQLCKAGLNKYVDIHHMKTGYNWFLHDEIKKNTVNNICREKYDLCIIDGPKNWTIDSSAFFLVDKLLKEGGYIIFDDYNWTYGEANSRRKSTDGILHDSLSEDELSLPHIKEIYELLVRQHANYSNFKIFQDKQWVMAQKIKVDKKCEMQDYRHPAVNNNLILSGEISKLYAKITKLKDNTSRYIVYGYGSFGQILNAFLGEQILFFVDMNCKSMNNPQVCSLEKGIKEDFDFILISVLGREDGILNNLICNFSVPLEKIILFNEIDK